MTRFIKAVLILAGIWGLPDPASAFTVGGLGAPDTLTYQGRLIESGVPASGPRNVTISLCTTGPGTGGTCYSSGAQGVLATSGLFRTTFTVPSAISLDQGTWWLEVQVGATTLAPREQLTSTPYAVYASTARVLGLSTPFGVNISSNVGINTPAPLSGLHLTAVSPYLGQAVLIAETSVTGDQPGLKLKGTGAAAGGFIELYRPGTTGIQRIDFLEGSSPQWELMHMDSAFNNRFQIAAPIFGPVMAFGTDGRVGVGTTNPAARLHVSSTTQGPGDTVMIVSTGTAPGSDALRVAGDGMVAVSTRLAIGKPGTLDALDVEFTGDTGLRLHNKVGGPASIRLFINGTKRTFIEAAPADSYIGTPAGENLHLRTNGQSRVFINGGSGAVGIGTTSPAAGSVLDVFGGSTTVTALNMNGAYKLPFFAPTGTTGLTAADHLVIPGCAGPCTLTLPPASAATIGQVFIIISNSSTNVVTIAPNGGDTQVGPTTISTPGARITVIGLTASSWVFAN